LAHARGWIEREDGPSNPGWLYILASVEAMGLVYVAGLDFPSAYDDVMAGDGASWLFSQRESHILDENKVLASSLMIITMEFVRHCVTKSSLYDNCC